MTRFESLLEAVPALVGMDISGVIRFVNHQSELLFGYERGDLVGRHIETLVPHSLWQVYLAHREDYFADPRTRFMGLDLELNGRHRDGGQFPVIVRLSYIDTGDVLLVITAVADVTRREVAVRNAQLLSANCRVLGRCHRQQHPRGSHHKLEPGRRADVRLLGKGDGWQVRHHPGSR